MTSGVESEIILNMNVYDFKICFQVSFLFLAEFEVSGVPVPKTENRELQSVHWFRWIELILNSLAENVPLLFKLTKQQIMQIVTTV